MTTRVQLSFAAALALFGGSCQAVLQTFTASPPYDWTAEPSIPSGQGIPLDITQDHTQGPAWTNRSLWVQRSFHGSSGQVVPDYISAQSWWGPPSQARIAQSTIPATITDQGGGHFQVLPILRLNAGAFIGLGLDFRSSVIAQEGSFISGGQLPSSRTFIAVEIPMADGLHYGFVEAAWGGFTSVAYSWGYETTPNTGFIVPAPGTAGVLASAGLLMAARRRRR